MKHILGTNSRSTLSSVREGDSQPNACDLRLGSVRVIDQSMPFRIDEESKLHRGSNALEPDQRGYYELFQGYSYEVIMENNIVVGEGEAGWVVTRSTLNRNGVFLTSGLYDSGYEGVMAAVLHNTTGRTYIKVGTRIGQYISFDAESLHLYDGSYGSQSEHDRKYRAFNDIV